VAAIQVHRSVGGGAYANVSLASPTATSVTQDIATASTVRYRVRAIDMTGNASAWRSGPTLAVGRTQEAQPAIVYGGGTWTPRSVAGTSDGKVRFATTSGATATFTFTGRAVGIVAKPEASSGNVDVYVNGSRVATVDVGSVATTARVVWSRSWTTQASRTVKLVVAGKGRVDLDAFVVLRDG
jgi:hypothetical protein